MPRWRVLSDELDPQVREFVEQLRRIVERNGMSVGAVADRTGYSKTSWERYLNGRLLPPRGATEALAEATGTDVGHLLTIWELAERAWSRSELRHDVTMEGLRVEAARAALAEYAPPSATGKRGWTLRRGRAKEPEAGDGVVGEGGPTEATGGGTPGVAAGVAPGGTVGAAPDMAPATVPETTESRREQGGRDEHDRGEGAGRPARFRTGLPSARAAGLDARAQAIPLTDPTGDSPADPFTTPSGLSAPSVNPSTDASAGPPVGPAAGPPKRPSGNRRPYPRPHPRSQPRPKRRAALLFTVGAVGALLMVVAAVLLLGYGPGGGARKAPPPAAAPETGGPAGLPAGVKCAGGACTGKDPESMGCGGRRATTAGSATVGSTYVEVRYSETCKAAWARMTQGGPGDTLRVSAASRTGEGRIERGTDGHSTMVAVAAPGEARACVVLSSGRQGCTLPRKPGAAGSAGTDGVKGAAGRSGASGAEEASEASQEVP
ncbi:helix-turn-helix domain-containing protein [Streptomyces mobaraensis]|uniref:DUF2690 domain-containing protein n=1 Tax=Streptomyces mobaraensis TaxID=35621 RepID=A0A5N5WHB2_STRMB|nr:XRE family transcriptional regulator [Streptomyces mobaraensis]KAB7852806.1 DUF2690 domain-containing protein [Streptomyces mobaraensis]